MAVRTGRRNAPRGTASRRDAQWLIYIILIICGLSYYGYKHWNAPPPAAIIGKAWVIDGDTVVISDVHIRLEGIDAPETDQTCTDANGKSWPCGQTATRELRGFIGGRGAEDRYGRTLAVCKLPDGSDVNAWLVRQGWALATGFVKMYESEQDEAEAAKRGIWAGTFTPPWKWRQEHPRRNASP
jgi:endonuclease YncB( thermonuclease family)